MNMYTLQILFILVFPAMSLAVEAVSPTDAELLQLEQQIKQQEAEQEKVRQRAAEETRRKAEEQKLIEERARLEEENRKQEEERQAEQEKKRQEEAKRRAEAQRIEAEEKRNRFVQHMEAAESAMNNMEYSNALQAYNRALEIIPDDATALAGQSLAQQYQEICVSLVGEWDWILATMIANANGTMKAFALIPNHGHWECTDPAQRKFTLRWSVGGWVDTVTVSEDGNKVDAINNIGVRFQAWRKGTKRDQPVSKNPIYGN